MSVLLDESSNQHQPLQVMEHETFDIKEIMESRRHDAEESLRTISVVELKALTDALFPDVTHPWLERFSEVVSDPASGTFYQAIVDERVHVLYCHDKNIGMWFIEGIGKGPLQPAQLEIMRKMVEARSGLG